MQLDELLEKFDATTEQIASRIIALGRDPNVVLDVRRGELRVRALTLPDPSALWFRFDMRRILQTPKTPAEIADQFVAMWQEAVRQDDEL